MKTLQNTKLSARKLATSLIQSGTVPVFDADGVFLDATHRQICNPDGSLNLDKYREMSTREYVMKDKALPLIEAIHILQKNEVAFHICTARVACENTLALLESLNVKPKSIMARRDDNDSRRDYILKTDHLKSKFSDSERANMVLIDDNMANCEAVQKINMQAINVPFEGH